MIHLTTYQGRQAFNLWSSCTGIHPEALATLIRDEASNPGGPTVRLLDSSMGCFLECRYDASTDIFSDIKLIAVVGGGTEEERGWFRRFAIEFTPNAVILEARYLCP